MREHNLFSTEITNLGDQIVKTLADNSAVFLDRVGSWIVYTSPNSEVYGEMRGTTSQYRLKVRLQQESVSVYFESMQDSSAFIGVYVHPVDEHPFSVHGGRDESLVMLDDTTIFNSLVALNNFANGGLEEAARRHSRVQEAYPDTSAAMFRFSTKFLLKLMQNW